jgi:hypothetical protein
MVGNLVCWFDGLFEGALVVVGFVSIDVGVVVGLFVGLLVVGLFVGRFVGLVVGAGLGAVSPLRILTEMTERKTSLPYRLFRNSFWPPLTTSKPFSTTDWTTSRYSVWLEDSTITF